MTTPRLPNSPESTPIDGRTARRDRGRTAALEAALELFEDGNLEPTPEEIAERAGISSRSMYRYFEDRDDLVRAVIAHKQLKILPFFQIEETGQGELEERLSRFIDSRLKVYEAIGATARAMTLKATSDPVIREQVEFRKSILRKQVTKVFAREFKLMNERDSEMAMNAIDTLTQTESLDYYVVDRGYSADVTRELLLGAIRALLAAHA